MPGIPGIHGIHGITSDDISKGKFKTIIKNSKLKYFV